MILRFFNSGKSNGSSPINYLLAKSDSKKQVRRPAPEVAMGDPELTKDLIDCNPRKYKYTSGVLAFRDGELPTKAQQKEIMKDFFLTFCAGLKPNQANMLWVRHQDKGNLELHFIVPRLEMTTMRAMNIMPPGKKSQQMARDFSSSWNHKLGFGQVVDDPLKAAFIDLDKKIPGGTRHGQFVEKIGANISRLVRQGKISSRDDLISLLESNDFAITRKGKDYLSIKLPTSFGVKRAISRPCRTPATRMNTSFSG